MKNIFLASFITLFYTVAVSSQERLEDIRITGSSLVNQKKKRDKPEGSPYAQANFSKATVAKTNASALMRYNAFADEFEFIAKGDTLVLDKTEDFSPITIAENKYVLLQYTNRKNSLSYGYLLLCHEKGDFSLYKKDNILLSAATTARTSFEKDTPARYINMSKTYYFKNGTVGVSEFPDSKKALSKMFPDKKQPIETYLKENKIDFSKESDMDKIVDFLAGN